MPPSLELTKVTGGGGKGHRKFSSGIALSNILFLVLYKISILKFKSLMTCLAAYYPSSVCTGFADYSTEVSFIYSIYEFYKTSLAFI